MRRLYCAMRFYTPVVLIGLYLDRHFEEETIMSLIMNDIEIIRQVRRLCLQHRFDEALSEAWKIEDSDTRQTLLAICNSFLKSQFKEKVA